MNRTTSSRRKRWFFARAVARAYREMLEKGRKKKRQAEKRQLFAEALEPRVLFSGTPAPDPDAANEEQAQDAENTAQTAELLDSVAAEGIEGVGNIEFDSEETEIDEKDIERLAREAVARWEESGLTDEQREALEQIEYQVAELEGEVIGATEGHQIYLDTDAAGLEWFVDETEWLDEEYVEIDGLLQAESGEAGAGVDLLSVIMHEQGHILGLLDSYAYGDSGVMQGLFVEGERRGIIDGLAEGSEVLSLEGMHYATLNVTTPTATWTESALGGQGWTNDGSDTAIFSGGTGGNITVNTTTNGNIIAGGVEFATDQYNLLAGTNGERIEIVAGGQVSMLDDGNNDHIDIYTDIVFQGDGALINEDNTDLMRVRGGVYIGGNTLTITNGAGYTQLSDGLAFDGVNSDEAIRFESSSTLTGTAASKVVVTGDAFTYLYADNSATFSGDWEILGDGAGTNPRMHVYSDGALGDSATSSVLLTGPNGQLRVQEGVTVDNQVTFDNSANSATRYLVWDGLSVQSHTGDVHSDEVNSNRALLFVSDSANVVNLSGQVSGNWIRKSGAGTLVLTNTGNTLSNMRIEGGGPLVVGASGAETTNRFFMVSTSTLLVGDGVTMNTTYVDFWQNGGTKVIGLEEGASSGTINSRIDFRPDDVHGDIELFAGAGGELTLNGQLRDLNGNEAAKGFTKTGAGTVVLTNSANNYGDAGTTTGSVTTVAEGTLLLRGGGVLPSTTDVTVNAGAYIGGSGVLADFGNSLTFAAGAGISVDVDGSGTPLLDLGVIDVSGLNLEINILSGVNPADLVGDTILANTTETFNSLTVISDGYEITTSIDGSGNVVIDSVTALVPETDVYLSVAGKLIIEDINGGTSDDNIIITQSGSNYVITTTNPANVVSNSDASGAVASANQVTIPVSSVTDGITFMSVGGTDTISIPNAIAVDGEFVVESADLLISGNTIIDTSSANALVSIGGAVIGSSGNEIVRFSTGSGDVEITGDTGNAMDVGRIEFPSEGTLTIDSDIVTDGNFRFDGRFNTGPGHTFVVNGKFLDGGNVSIFNDSRVTVNSDNSAFTGNWTVNAQGDESRLIITDANALGRGAVTLAGTSADLWVDADGTVPNDITLNNSEGLKLLRVQHNHTVDFTGTLNFGETSANGNRFVIEDNANVTVSGSIVSTTGFYIQNGNTSSQLTLAGDNSGLVGTVTLGGPIQLNIANALALAGDPDIQISDGAQNNVIRLDPSLTAFTIAGNLIIGEDDNLASPLTRIEVNTGQTLTLSGDISSVNGNGAGAGNFPGFGKDGDGTLVIAGASNSITGNVDIDGGEVEVSTAITALGVTVSANGTLGGAGTVAAAVTSVGGTIRPGTSTTIGTLTADGAVTLDAASTLQIRVQDAATSDTLAISATGTINLADATLNMVTTADLSGMTIGDEILLVDVATGTATGSFAGVTMGASTVSLGGMEFLVTNTGGTGNDVVLEALGVPETTVTLSGGALVITDVNTDSADALDISYDSGAGEYVIIDTGGLLVGTSGFAAGDMTRPDQSTVRIKASAVTGGLTVNTAFAGDANPDSVTISSNVTFPGAVTINAGTINLNGDLTANDAATPQNITLNASVNLGASVAVSADELGITGALALNGNTLTATVALDSVLGTKITSTGGGITVAGGVVSLTNLTNDFDDTVNLQANAGSELKVRAGAADLANFTANGGQITLQQGAAGPDLGGVTGDLALWLDAQDINGDGSPTLDGAEVVTWVDKSGNPLGENRSLTNGGGTGNDPAYLASSALGGKPAVFLDGDDQLIGGYDYSGLGDNYTIISVSRYAGTPGVADDYGRLISSDDNNWLFGYWMQSNDAWFAQSWINMGDRDAHIEGDNIWNVHTGVIGPDVNGTVGEFTGDPAADFWRNGVQIANDHRGSDDTNYKPGLLSLGAYTTNTHEASVGEIAEVIIFDRALSNADRLAVEDYLNQKWFGATADFSENSLTVLANSTVHLDDLGQADLAGLTIAAGATLDITSSIAGADVNFTSTTLNGGTAGLDANDTTNVTLNEVTETGVAHLTLGGDGTVNLPVANSYTGTTTVNGTASLVISNPGSLGTANATVVNSGAQLVLNGGITVAGETLALNGGKLVSQGGANAYDGAITTTGTGILGGETELTINGAIGGDAVSKVDDNTVIFATGNGFGGTTTVSGGVLVAQTNTALGTTAAGTTIADGATLVIEAGVSIGSGETFIVSGSGAPGQLGAIVGDGAGTSTINGLITGAGTQAGLGANAGNTLLITGDIDLALGGLVTNGTGDITITGAVSGAIGASADPTTQTGLQLWLDAGDIDANGAADVIADGAKVETWDDKSGNDRDATIRLGDPNISLGEVNGLPVVQFRSGTNNGTAGDEEYNVGGSAFFAKEMYFVFRSPTPVWSDFGGILGHASSRESNFIFQRGDSNFHNSKLPASVTKNGVDISSAGRYNLGVIDEYMVLRVEVNNNDPGDKANYRVGDITGWSMDMDLAEVIAYDTVLDSSGRNTVQGYLASKYNISGDFAGNTVIKEGSGTLTLSGDNRYGGKTTVEAGELVATHDNALGSDSFGTEVANGATLTVQGGVTIADDLLLIGNGKTGSSGTLVSAFGDNTLTGEITAGDVTQTITIASLQDTLTIDGDVDTNFAQLNLVGAGDIAVNGDISSETLISAVSFTNVNGYRFNGNDTDLPGDASQLEGPVAVADGDSVYFSNEAAIINFFPGATDMNQSAATWVGNLNIPGSGNIDVMFRSTSADDAVRIRVDLNQDGSFSGGFEDPFGGDRRGTFVSDAISIPRGVDVPIALQMRQAIGAARIQPEFTFDDGVTWYRFTAGELLPLAPQEIVKSGTGTVTFAGDNIYAGDTLVTVGTLVAAADTALGNATGETVVSDGAVLALSGGITIRDEAITATGNGSGDGALVNVSGDNTIDATASLTAATISAGELGIGSTSVGETLTINADVDLQFSKLGVYGNGDIVVNGMVQGEGADQIDPTFQETVLTHNPAALYTFDSLVDSDTFVNEGTGSTASLLNGATIVPGFQGNGLGIKENTTELAEVDGNGRIDLPSADWTVGAWFNGLHPQGDWRTLFRGIHHQIIIENNSQELGIYNAGFAGTGYSVDGSQGGPDVTTGWHFIAAVGDATSTTFYIDGVQVGTPANKTSDTFIQQIGNFGTQTFADTLDNVFVVTSSLTAADIQEMWDARDSVGVLVADNNLMKQGAGTLTLTAANTYSGTTTVSAGALILDGSHTGGDAYTIADGATLGGEGTTDASVNASANAIITPGESELEDIGVGTLTLDENTIVELSIAGTTPATDHDQIDVTGTIDLDGTGTNGATLALTLDYTPTADDVIVLIDKDGTTDAVDGTFRLPDGTVLADDAIFALTNTVDGSQHLFQIHYDKENAISDTAGNNVVLVALGAAETSVEIDNGKLVITDIQSDSQDNLTITDDGTNYIVSDSSLNLISTTAAITRIDANTYSVAKSDVTAGLEIVTANSPDTVGNNDTVTLAGPVDTEVDFDFGGPMTLDVETLNLQANIVGGHELNLTANGVNVLVNQTPDTTLGTEPNPVEIAADITASNANFRKTAGNGAAFFNGDNHGLSGTTTLHGFNARWGLGTDTALGAVGHTVRVGTNTNVGQQWLIASGNRTIASDMIIDTQRLIIRNHPIAGSPSGTITIDGDVTLSQDSGQADIFTQRDLTINGVLSGSTGLEKHGGSTLTLTNAGNDFTGGVDFISASTLVVSDVGALGDTGNVITFAGAGTLQVDADGTIAQTVVLASNRTGTINTNGNDVTLSNTISGGGNLTKTGDGTLTLEGNNTYGGTTTIDAGTIKLDGITAVDMTAVTATASTEFSGRLAEDAINRSGMSGAAPGGTINTGSASTMWMSQPGDPSDQWIQFDFGSVRSLSGAHIWNYAQTGQLDRGINLVDIQTSSNGSSFTSVQTGSFPKVTGTGIGDTGFDFAFDTPIETQYLRFQVNGTHGDNAYVGLSEVQFFETSKNLPSTTALTLTASGATLDVNGRTAEVGSLSGVSGSSVLLGGGRFTVGNDDSNTTFDGVISEAGDFIKVGDGILLLGDVNTYTGDTSIRGGVVTTSNSNALGSNPASTLTVSDSTLNLFDDAAAITTAGTVDLSAGTGTINTGAGTLAISEQLDLTDAVTLKYTPGNGETTFSVQSSDLVDSAVTRNFTVSGGTVAATSEVAINPDSASASTNFNLRTPDRTIDDSGMSVDDDAVSLSVTSDGPNNTMWMSTGAAADPAADQFLTFDFVSATEVNAVQVWNYGQLNFTNRGIKDVKIQSSNDGVNFTDVQTEVFPEGTGLGDAGFIVNFDSPINARYIRFDVESNHGGGEYAGLSEVQFYQRNPVDLASSHFELDGAGATLDVTNHEVTIASLTGAAGSGVVLEDGSLTVGDDTTSTTFAGVISGAGDLVKTGVSTLTLSGINTYTGKTDLTKGTITITNTGEIGNGGPAGTVTLGSGTTLNVGGNIFAPIHSTAVTPTINVTANVELGDGTKTSGFDFEGILNAGAHTVTILDSNVASIGRGTIVDNGGTVIAANGLNMSDGNVISGDGTIDVGITPSTDLSVFGGTISPGEGEESGEAGAGADGLIDPTETLTIDGNIDFGDGFFTLDLDGVDGGDLLEVDGLVNVGSATLTIRSVQDLEETNNLGDEIILIDNDLVDAVTGQFVYPVVDPITGNPVPIPEGGTVTAASGEKFTLSYIGGDGNDVVLYVGEAETEVSIDTSGNLVITDILNDTSDALVISEATENGQLGLRITDPNVVLTTLGTNTRTSPAGVLRIDAHTVFVPYTSFSGVIVNTPNETNTTDTGTDSVTIGDLTLTTGGLEVNAEDITLTGAVNTGAGDVDLNSRLQIDMEDGARVVTTTGNVTFDALPAVGGGARGIELQANNRIETLSGNITLAGTGASTGGNSRDGIFIGSGSTIESDSGEVRLEGTGTGTNAANDGIEVSENTTIQVGDGGKLFLEGTGGGQNSNNNTGLRLQGNITATGTGTIELTGIGGDALGNNRGIFIPSNAVISVVDGDLKVDGTGGKGTANNNEGILNQGTIRTTGDGNVTMAGQGGGTVGLNNRGIQVQGIIESTDVGKILLTGVGGGNVNSDSNGNQGILLNGAGAVIRSTGIAGTAGTVTLNGTGGNANGNNSGVFLNSGTSVESAAGAILIIGQGGSQQNENNNNNNDGIRVNGAITATGDATITLEGTGGGTGGTNNDFNDGVEIDGDLANITSVNGTISITGVGGGAGSTAGSANDGVEIINDAQVSATGTGAIRIRGSLNGDAIDPNQSGTIIDSTIESAGGTVTIDSVDTVIFGANSLIDSDSGTVTVNSNVNSIAANDAATVSMSDGALIDAGTGTIDINSSGDVTLGGLLTDDVVTIDSTNGNVLDGGDIHKEIVATSATLNALNGSIGTVVDPLETQLANLEGSSSGDFAIKNIGVLTLGGITAGPAALNVGGNLSVTNDEAINDDTANAVGVGGNATFTTTGNDADITLNTLQVTGQVSVNSTGAGSDATITDNIDLDLATSNVTGTLTATATEGNVVIGNGVTVESASGNVTINAEDDFTFDAGGTLSAEGGSITINIDTDNLNEAAGTGGIITLAGTVNANNDQVFLVGNADGDLFTVTPSANTGMNIEGNDPTTVGNGDTIEVVTTSETTFRSNDPDPALADSAAGTYSFDGGERDINFTEVENDNIGPEISVEIGNGDSAVEALVETDAPLQVDGTLTVFDLGTVEAEVDAAVDVVGSAFNLTPGDFQGMFSITPVAPNDVITAPDTAGQIQWDFNSNGQTFDFLAKDETLTLTYTIRVTDQDGLEAIQEVSVTITGTNDLPVLAPDTSQVFESGVGGPDVAVGKALANDTDIDQDGNAPDDVLSVVGISFDGTPFAGAGNGAGAVPAAGAKAVDGFYGTLQISADGNFVYSLDNDLVQVRELRAGDVRTDTFTYTVSDGNGGVVSEKITVTINGAEGASVNGILISGGSNILEGFRFAEAGGFLFDRDEAAGEEQPLLTLIPTYSGSSAPGTILTIRVLGSGGGMLPGGERVVVADFSGTWFVTFDGLVLGDGNHYIQIESRSPAWNTGTPGVFQTFFSPGINGTFTEFQELTVESIFGRRLTSVGLEEVIHENTHPIGSNEDWRNARGVQSPKRTPGGGDAYGDGQNGNVELPESVEDLFLLAQEAAGQENYTYAIFLLEKALEQQPEFEQASELLEELKEKADQN